MNKDLLKFRVWCPILSCWNKSNQLCLRPSGHVTDGSIAIDSKYLQFCTGLKDSNNKLIYEGDILLEYVNNESDTNIGICKPILGGWRICNAKKSSIYWHGWKQKIIGNVFEHKELLK